VLGEANASAERRRIVPAGSYSIGIVAAAQPEVLGPLFDDLAVGTPQRFLYFAGTDPTLPDEPPRWPGPLSRTPIDLERAERAFLAIRPHHVRIHINVAAEIRQGDLLRQRGQDSGGPWAAHRNLLRLKVAALVAVLDGGRVDVSEDDWRLAGMVVDVSDAVRTGAQRALAASAAEREAETSLRYAQRAVHADKLTEDRRTLACVDAIVAKVTRKPGELTRGKLRASMGARQRDFFGEAFDRAIDFGVIEERSQPGQGEDRARLYPKGARR